MVRALNVCDMGWEVLPTSPVLEWCACACECACDCVCVVCSGAGAGWKICVSNTRAGVHARGTPSVAEIESK